MQNPCCSSGYNPSGNKSRMGSNSNSGYDDFSEFL